LQHSTAEKRQAGCPGYFPTVPKVSTGRLCRFFIPAKSSGGTKMNAGNVLLVGLYEIVKSAAAHPIGAFAK
jgi:hypothetical protein